MRVRLKPILKDILLTFTSEVLVMFGFFIMYRLIANQFGPDGVGEYSLIRKAISFLQPLLLLGMSIGIPRYLAIARNEHEGNLYFKAGSLAVIALTSVFLLIINLFRDIFSEIFFGNSIYENYVLAFSVFLFGLTFHTVVYSYFRGKLQVEIFNIMQILNLFIIPVGILVVCKDINISGLVTITGITTLIISVFFFLLSGGKFVYIKHSQLKRPMIELLKYGLPRIPGSFAFAGLFSLGPIMVVHFSSIKEAGYLSISQNILTIIGGLVVPLGLIMLPKMSSLKMQRRENEIEDNLNHLIGATIQGSVFIFAQLMLFADVIITYWLGPEFIGAVVILRIIIISLIFYLFYASASTILDAIKTRPINAINNIISLILFVLISSILLGIYKIYTPVISISIAFSLSLICLGVLSYLSLRRLYPKNMKKDLIYLFTSIALNIPLVIVAMVIKYNYRIDFYFWLILELILSVIYLSLLWKMQVDWLKRLFSKIEFNYKSLY